MPDQVRPGNTFDGRLCARDILANRIIGPHKPIEYEVNNLPRRVVGGADLFDDNGSFFLYVAFGEAGIAQYVGQDVYSLTEVPMRDQGTIVCMLVVCACIEIAAHALDCFRDLNRVRTALSPFEYHVFHEVAYSTQRRRFMPCAYTNVKLHGRRPSVRHRRSDNPQAVWQYRQ